MLSTLNTALHAGGRLQILGLSKLMTHKVSNYQGSLVESGLPFYLLITCRRMPERGPVASERKD